MDNHDMHAYHAARAEYARRMASEAADKIVSALHLELATRHDELAEVATRRAAAA